MCLWIDKNKHPDGKPRVASRDIRVYKLLREDNVSPYIACKYIKNTTKRVKKMEVARAVGHCVFPRKEFVGVGLHAHRTKRAAMYELGDNHYEKVVVMYIPKGAKYYIGEDLDIVSNSLLVGNLEPINKKSR